MSYFVTHLDDARQTAAFQDVDEAIWHYMTESGIPSRVIEKRGDEIKDELLEIFHNEGELDPENSRDLEVFLTEAKAARLTVYMAELDSE